jgi:hypothetical protein
MREFVTCVFATAMLARAGVPPDTGVPPRDASTDYSAHGPAAAATIAADIIPANQVAKMFSSEISKDYIVVEVAIYPDNGVPFDVKLSDFALRVGQRVTRADQPIDVSPWQERRSPSRNLPRGHYGRNRGHLSTRQRSLLWPSARGGNLYRRGSESGRTESAASAQPQSGSASCV